MMCVDSKYRQILIVVEGNQCSSRRVSGVLAGMHVCKIITFLNSPSFSFAGYRLHPPPVRRFLP